MAEPSGLVIGCGVTMWILADMHVHSNHSFDGTSSLGEMCRAAVDLGITHLCFAEHFDLDPRSRAYGHFCLDRYERDIEQCRRAFGDSLEILKGIEFSEPHLHRAELEEVQGKNFDVVLGSVHRIDGVPLQELGTRMPKEQIMELYYQEVLAMVEVGGFDVLAHLDLPRRYIGVSLDDSKVIGPIFAQMRKNDIALETNTSVFKDDQGRLTSLRLMEMWLSCGGQNLVVGSDAHSPRAVGRMFEDTASLLKQAGASYGFFRDRRYHALPW